jgi:hypothetical protein
VGFDASDAGVALCGTFEEPDASLVLCRDPGRFVSWSWNAHPDVVQGLFVPRDGDHLVEWNGNLAPSIVVLDQPPSRSVAWRWTTTFAGGFATIGVVHLAGGALAQHVTCVALPDGRSALYADDVRARWDITILYQEGLRLNLGNDLFNGYRRRLRFGDSAGGEAVLVAGQTMDPRLSENLSRWLVVDDLLGVQFLDEPRQPWSVRTFARRNATDMSAWYAILCRPCRSGVRRFLAGAAVQRTCTRLVANVDGAEWASASTCSWRDAVRSTAAVDDAPILRVDLPGLDGQRYRVIADWSGHRVAVDTP